MSDPTLSDNDLKNEMAWVWATLNEIFEIFDCWKFLKKLN